MDSAVCTSATSVIMIQGPEPKLFASVANISTQDNMYNIVEIHTHVHVHMHVDVDVYVPSA